MSTGRGLRGRVWAIALALFTIPLALEAATWPLSANTVRPARRVVGMQAFAFQPAVVKAAVGDTLVWVNHDMVPHAVTATGGAWTSGSIAANASWQLVVKKPGTVPYLCPYHPTMKGTLVVD